MAGLAAVSTAAAVISATQSALDLNARASSLFVHPDARDYLNEALKFREESLRLMEKHKSDIPHKVVHEWRVKHTNQLKTWQDLQVALDAFNSLGIMKRTFNRNLRKNLTSSAALHAQDCKESWTKALIATDTARSQIVSRIARENGILDIDLVDVSSENRTTFIQDSTTTIQTPPDLSAQHDRSAAPRKSHDGTNPFASPEEYDLADMPQPATLTISISKSAGTSKSDSAAAT